MVKTTKNTSTQPEAFLQEELTQDTKTILTVILLVTFYPVGLYFVFKWMSWPKWLKGVLTLPLIPFALALIFAIIGISSALL